MVLRWLVVFLPPPRRKGVDCSGPERPGEPVKSAYEPEPPRHPARENDRLEGIPQDNKNEGNADDDCCDLHAIS